MIKVGNAYIFLIQETKLNCVDSSLVSSFYNHERVGWSYVSSKGQSSGILTMWREKVIYLCCSFKGDGFLGIKLKWMDQSYYMVNIYSHCS